MLLQRFLTGIVLAALVIAVIFVLPPQVMFVLISLAALVGAWEWAGFLGRGIGTGGRIGYVAFIALTTAGAWWIAQTPGGYRALLWLSLAWWVVAFAWILRFPTPVPRAATFICGALVLTPFWVGLMGIFREAGDAQWLFYVLVVTIGADIGAYFTGRSLGRIRLAPSVSPGKTWEGLIGGVVVSLLLSLAAAQWFGVPTARLLLLTGAVALISVVGDLTVSMFKRDAGLKDSGQLLPGHGGLLDRVDSLSSSIPLFAIGFSWL